MRKPYVGLTASSTDPRVLQAYYSWRNQNYRCKNPSRREYKNYGAKGIKVRYSAREFIAWWLENLASRDWKDPTVGRIDHNGDYCFENVEMQERAENTREVHARRGNPGGVKKRPVVVRDNSGNVIASFPSTRAAARELGLFQGEVVFRCQGRMAQDERIISYAEAK